jgi:F-type H+-transporting ATPase subunit delta
MEQNAIPQIEKDVAELQAMLGVSEDLRSMILSPLVKTGAQQAVLTALADKAKFSALTKNFLLTLASNRRLKELESMLKAVTENVSARRGELRAKVESAIELSSAQKKSLEDQLAKTIGRPVAIDATVNKELIGGVTITLGSLMIDDSIKTKLERMGRAMKHNGAKAA